MQTSAHLQLSGMTPTVWSISAPLDGIPGYRRVTPLASFPSLPQYVCVGISDNKSFAQKYTEGLSRERRPLYLMSDRPLHTMHMPLFPFNMYLQLKNT